MTDHSLRGPTDRGALLDFRDAFEQVEPLADGELDDFLNPRELRITMADGVGEAESGRFDVVWTTLDDYNVHYTDEMGRNLRWDRHPNDYPGVGEAHFHSPTGVVEASAIDVTEIELVARAVHRLWRTAYERGTLEGINGRTGR